jgi:radical SAM superfamily enzyme YgiQ (UPF0313 family)
MMTRIDAVNEELLDMAYKAGCRQIEYGVESGCADTLKKIHKPHTADMVRRVIPLTKRFGIQPVAFFILGFPWEDVSALEETKKLMEDISPCVVFHPAIASILVPFPGTEIYERYKDEYGFADWWLGDERNFDAPKFGKHAFFETVLFRVGVALDADFFRYSEGMKKQMHRVFRFMYASNLRPRNFLVRRAQLLALDLSRSLSAISPKLERSFFSGPLRLKRSLDKIRGKKESIG